MNSTTASAAGSSNAHIWVVLAALLQIATPVLPSLGLGEQIGSQSDSVRTLITPAGWAFSIWGALYTGSLAFAVYQFLGPQRRNPLLAQLRGPAASAFLGNALWALYVQFFGLTFISTVIIAFTLVNLLIVLRRLTAWHGGFTTGERWLAVLPLSALAAWLSAATIVNVAASLRYHGVEAGDAAPLVAAAIVVVGGAIAGSALLSTLGNPPYALVFLWALSAIYSAGGQEASAVALATGVAALLVVAGTAVGLSRAGARKWLGGDHTSATVAPDRA